MRRIATFVVAGCLVVGGAVAPSAQQDAQASSSAPTPLVVGPGTSKSTRWLALYSGLTTGAAIAPRASLTQRPRRSCSVKGEIVTFSNGSCDVRLTIGRTSRTVRVTTRAWLPRSTVDRPGANVLDIKPIYVTFKDGADDRHDVNGLIAQMVSSSVDWMAEQNPGFTIRVDTFQGLPDIQHVQLPVTQAEFLANWTTTYGPIARYLADAGLDVNLTAQEPPVGNHTQYHKSNRIYVGIVESPTGLKPGFLGGHTTPGCDINVNVNVILWYARDTSNRACTHKHGGFRYGGPLDANWDTEVVRHLIAPGVLRSNVDCDKTWNGYFGLPTPQQDNERTGINDPITYKYVGPPRPPWKMDVNGAFYFKIRQGPRANDPCWDLAFSPFWTRLANTTEVDDRVAGRAFVDRPDDTTLPQVHVYYVLARDSVDRRSDVNGSIARALDAGNKWLLANGGKSVRYDTFQGGIDVTFVRLDQTEAQLWMEPDDPTKKCRQRPCPFLPTVVSLLRSKGLAPSTDISVILYGGQTTPASRPEWPGCGYAGGRERALLYPLGQISVFSGQQECMGPESLATSPQSFNALGLSIIHEIFHVLGAVGASPNSDSNGSFAGHIVNDPTDLMGGSVGVVRLDPGRDDYWGHGRSDIVDVSKSVFLTPTDPNAVFPPGWSS